MEIDLDGSFDNSLECFNANHLEENSLLNELYETLYSESKLQFDDLEDSDSNKSVSVDSDSSNPEERNLEPDMQRSGIPTRASPRKTLPREGSPSGRKGASPPSGIPVRRGGKSPSGSPRAAPRGIPRRDSESSTGSSSRASAKNSRESSPSSIPSRSPKRADGREASPKRVASAIPTKGRGIPRKTPPDSPRSAGGIPTRSPVLSGIPRKSSQMDAAEAPEPDACAADPPKDLEQPREGSPSALPSGIPMRTSRFSSPSHARNLEFAAAAHPTMTSGDEDEAGPGRHVMKDDVMTTQRHDGAEPPNQHEDLDEFLQMEQEMEAEESEPDLIGFHSGPGVPDVEGQAPLAEDGAESDGDGDSQSGSDSQLQSSVIIHSSCSEDEFDPNRKLGTSALLYGTPSGGGRDLPEVDQFQTQELHEELFHGRQPDFETREPVVQFHTQEPVEDLILEPHAAFDDVHAEHEDARESEELWELEEEARDKRSPVQRSPEEHISRAEYVYRPYGQQLNEPRADQSEKKKHDECELDRIDEFQVEPEVEIEPDTEDNEETVDNLAAEAAEEHEDVMEKFEMLERRAATDDIEDAETGKENESAMVDEDEANEEPGEVTEEPEAASEEEDPAARTESRHEEEKLRGVADEMQTCSPVESHLDHKEPDADQVQPDPPVPGASHADAAQTRSQSERDAARAEPDVERTQPEPAASDAMQTSSLSSMLDSTDTLRSSGDELDAMVRANLSPRAEQPDVSDVRGHADVPLKRDQPDVNRMREVVDGGVDIRCEGDTIIMKMGDIREDAAGNVLQAAAPKSSRKSESESTESDEEDRKTEGSEENEMKHVYLKDDFPGSQPIPEPRSDVTDNARGRGVRGQRFGHDQIRHVVGYDERAERRKRIAAAAAKAEFGNSSDTESGDSEYGLLSRMRPAPAPAGPSPASPARAAPARASPVAAALQDSPTRSPPCGIRALRSEEFVGKFALDNDDSWSRKKAAQSSLDRETVRELETSLEPKWKQGKQGHGVADRRPQIGAKESSSPEPKTRTLNPFSRDVFQPKTEPQKEGNKTVGSLSSRIERFQNGGVATADRVNGAARAGVAPGAPRVDAAGLRSLESLYDEFESQVDDFLCFAESNLRGGGGGDTEDGTPHQVLRGEYSLTFVQL